MDKPFIDKTKPFISNSNEEDLPDINFAVHTDENGNITYASGWCSDIIISKIEIDPKTGKAVVKTTS